MCLVLYTTYTCNLMAFLTISSLSVPFSTLDEMVRQTEYNYGTSRGNVLTHVFAVGKKKYIFAHSPKMCVSSDAVIVKVNNVKSCINEYISQKVG